MTDNTYPITVDPEAEHSLRILLEKLNRELVPQQHQEIRKHYMKSMMWEPVDRPPLRLLFQERLQRLEEKSSDMYPINEAVHDPAKLLVNELWHGRASSMGWLQVRTNLGTGLTASAMGSHIEVIENNPPWPEPLTNDLDAIPGVIEKMLAELDVEETPNHGWNPKATAFYRYFQQIPSEYPNVEKSFAICMPDLQGPFDTAAMLWGSDIFVGLYAHEALVDRLQETVAKTQVRLYIIATLSGVSCCPKASATSTV